MPDSGSLTPLGRPRTNRFRSRSLGAVASTAAAAGIADSASAAIISDLTTTYSMGDTISFDGTAASELTLLSVVGMMGEISLSLDAPSAGMMAPISTVELSIFNAGGMMDPNYLTLLNPSDTVDGSLFFAPEGFLVEKSITNPDWSPGTIGYAGFVFDPGTGPLYGWLQVEFAASGLDFTVLQSAYDDTGAPIPVAFIPEPSTALLLGLGLAGLAAGVKRRRRSIVNKKN